MVLHPDELSFTAHELVGLRVNAARQLHQQRDRAYVRGQWKSGHRGQGSGDALLLIHHAASLMYRTPANTLSPSGPTSLPPAERLPRPRVCRHPGQVQRCICPLAWAERLMKPAPEPPGRQGFTLVGCAVLASQPNPELPATGRPAIQRATRGRMLQWDTGGLPAPHALPRVDVVQEFQGPFRWLSNFWPAPVMLDGVWYPEVERAYVAAKTLLRHERAAVLASTSPSAAKRLGRTLTLRPDWDTVKVAVMFDLVQQKFVRHPQLATLLLATEHAEIQEGNNWRDAWWGVDLRTGCGANHLGRMLMQVRHELTG